MLHVSVDAVLFDLDGTLVDESESYREAIRSTAQCLLDRPVSDEDAFLIKRHPGLNNDWDATWALVSEQSGGAPVPPTREQQRSPEYARLRSIFQTYYLGSTLWEELSGESAPFPWTEPYIRRESAIVSRETLDMLQPFLLGIATSRPRLEALMALEQHALEPYFPAGAVVAREDAPREKPDPAPLLAAAARLDCREPVYVGDTVNDALAADAAGMPFIGVGPLLHDLDLRYRLRDVNDLATVLPRPTSGKGVNAHD